MIKVGMIFKPTDSRRANRRIRIDRTTKTKGDWYALVSARLVGQKTWKPAPAIRLDRLEGRHYKLIRA